MADTLSILNFANSQFLLNPPSFYGYQAVAQSVSNNTWTSITIDTGVDDNWTGHSNVTNSNRYTAQVAGTYLVTGCAAFVANGTGIRTARLTKNGTALLGSGSYTTNIGAGSPVTATTPTIEVALVVGDWVELQGFQSSGASLNTFVGGTDISSSLTVRFSHF